MQVNQVGDRGGNVSHSTGALRQAQVAGHYNEVQIQNNVFFTLDGVYGGLAPIDNLNASFAGANYTGPSNTNVPACNSAIFALWVASNNTLTVTRGDVVDASKLSGTANGTGSATIPYPAVESAKALIGLVRVTVGTGASFTYGTTNFNASNVNTAFYSCATMPANPLTS